MTGKELIQLSLQRCERLEQEYGDFPPLASLRGQLRYLLDLEEGRTGDRSRVRELSILVIAAREIEDRDPELAELLYQLMDQLGI